MFSEINNILTSLVTYICICD